MKLIFSRKGFDSKNGGVPSPILPDGRIRSLPIPDDSSEISYSQISWHELNLGTIAEDLTKNKVRGYDKAHLDPDIDPTALPRKKGWKGMFGPSGPAETHLINKEVSAGDLFLFFGWFKRTEWVSGRLRYAANARDVHLIYGWLQFENGQCVDEFTSKDRSWAAYHPHFSPDRQGDDMILLANDRLKLPKLTQQIPGSGVFSNYKPALCLTAPGRSRSIWQLPKWIYPTNEKQTLSCHGDMKRWTKDGDFAYLETVPIGQEFVLDCEDYPESTQWLKDLFKSCLA